MALLYGIAASLKMGQRLVGLGVPYVQLRIKGGFPEEDLAEVRGWSSINKSVRMVMNDSVELALRAKVWGVHLGQQDLRRYEDAELCQMGLCLGVSVHNEKEWKKVQHLSPGLVGFGPIFSPLSKQVSYRLQGVEGLRKFLRRVSCPVAAIGGISAKNMREVADSGVAMIAILSGLKGLSDGEIKDLMRQMARPGDMDAAGGGILPQ